MRIGVETRLMTGRMTGVGNFSFHLLRALVENPTLDFVGFSDFNWSNVDRQMLDRLATAQAKTSLDKSASSSTRGSLTAFGRRAVKLGLVGPAYRATRSFLFARTVGGRRLDLFHALNFLPPSEPGVPVLPVVHDLSFLRYPDSHPKERLQWLAGLGAVIARAPLVHTVSEFSKSEIHAVYGTPLDRIFIAPPAAAAIFRPLGEAAARKDLETFGLVPQRYLLAVGTLEPRKNLRTLIAAFSRLSPHEQQRTPLVIVGGSGWGNIDLPKEAPQLVSAGHLRFVGAVSDAQLRSLYENAAALLFPSIYEGFGMPVVEAMSCGTAVVHSEGTAMSEITMDLAKRIPALDVEAWTRSMREATDIPTQPTEKARAARIARAQSFQWETSARTVATAYATIAGRSHR